MSHIENGQDSFQKTNCFGFRPRQPEQLILLKNGVKWLAVEPLENHVGNPLPSGRGVGAHISGLHNACGLAGELGQQSAFLDELMQQLFPVFGGGLG